MKDVVYINLHSVSMKGRLGKVDAKSLVSIIVNLLSQNLRSNSIILLLLVRSIENLPSTVQCITSFHSNCET